MHTGGATPQARMAYEPQVAARRPPKEPRRAGGLSGRPSCRIYPSRHVWVLELEPACGGWIVAPASGADGDGSSKSGRLLFPTAAAIAYAERHGLDYRVVVPKRHRVATGRNRRAARSLPKSWLARLERSGRNGDIYHG
jgi:hypothetical protein